MPKPPVTATTAIVDPSIPVRLQTRSPGPVAAHIPPVTPHVPVSSAPAVSRITWKGISIISQS